MMIMGKHRIKNHMTLEYDFAGIRILNGSLVPVDWHLTVDLVALDKKNKNKEEAEYKATVAYQKLYFWLDTNLPNIVILDVNDEDDLYIANLSSNIMMYCPGEPYDDTIAELLHSKLSVLADGHLLVGEVQIKGSDMSVKYTFDTTDGEYSLPETTADYYTEGITRDEAPWWARNDGFCFEFIRPEDSEVPPDELFKDIVDPLDEFTRIIEEARNVTAAREPAGIVQVEKWKPKKV